MSSCPLTKEGIDTLEVYKNKELIERFQQSDLPEHVLESSRRSTVSEVLTDTREALLKVVKANFEEGKWTFSDGTAKFNATINDSVFQRRLDNREIGFYKGDVLRVRLKTVQALQPSGKFKTDYSIEEVLDHRPLPTQRRMDMEPKPSMRDERRSLKDSNEKSS